MRDPSSSLVLISTLASTLWLWQRQRLSRPSLLLWSPLTSAWGLTSLSPPPNKHENRLFCYCGNQQHIRRCCKGLVRPLYGKGLESWCRPAASTRYSEQHKGFCGSIRSESRACVSFGEAAGELGRYADRPYGRFASSRSHEPADNHRRARRRRRRRRRWRRRGPEPSHVQLGHPLRPGGVRARQAVPLLRAGVAAVSGGLGVAPDHHELGDRRLLGLPAAVELRVRPAPGQPAPVLGDSAARGPRGPAGLRAGGRVPLGARGRVLSRRQGGAPGAAELAPPELVPLGRVHVLVGRRRRPPRGFGVGAGERVPLGRADVLGGCGTREP